MLNFRVKIDSITTHDSYTAWKEAQHDDLVLGLSVAALWGENCPETTMLDLLMTQNYHRFPSMDGDGFRCGYYG